MIPGSSMQQSSTYTFSGSSLIISRIIQTCEGVSYNILVSNRDILDLVLLQTKLLLNNTKSGVVAWIRMNVLYSILTLRETQCETCSIFQRELSAPSRQYRVFEETALELLPAENFTISQQTHQGRYVRCRWRILTVKKAIISFNI